MNPCSCGCLLAVITKCQKQISGPLLDRIDVYIEVPRVDSEKLSSDRIGETSAKIRIRLQAATEPIEVSEFYAGGDNVAQFVGACLSSYPKVGTHDHGLGGDAAISSEDHDGVIVALKQLTFNSSIHIIVVCPSAFYWLMITA
jgi:hypothetical protein